MQRKRGALALLPEVHPQQLEGLMPSLAGKGLAARHEFPATGTAGRMWYLDTWALGAGRWALDIGRPANPHMQ